ncbi:MAG: alpha/beta hydrolase [Actinomycetales bacterium]|nr:alpha/beta hydrolase [Actinomycetales bacterium]
MELKLMRTADGATHQVWFAAQGPKLAVYHHGIPKPRALTAEELAVFAEFGYSVACPIRAGYLQSTPQPPAPMLADAATTAEIVDQLGFDTFISIGFSGGGPRALGDALKNPKVSAAATFGSVAAPHLDFDYFGELPKDEADAMLALKEAGLAMLPQFEKWAASSPEMNVGAEGWLNDELSMLNDWGFDPAEIQKPVVLVASEADQNVPLSHSRWLQGRIGGSVLIEEAGLEHDHIFNPSTIRAALKRFAE